MEKLPHRNELMGPTVEAVKALGGSGSNEEIVDKVVSLLGIPDDLAILPYVSKRGNEDGRTQLEYDLAWARTYLKQLGILENSTRGVWSVTGKDLKDDSIHLAASESSQPVSEADSAYPSRDWVCSS
jgi:restriction system protein